MGTANRYLAAAIAVAIAACSIPVAAENGCPAGFQPWRIPMQGPDDCVPIPGYYDEPEHEAGPAPPPLPPEWFSTSSAVAFGSRKRDAAFPTDFVYFKTSFSDEEDARQLAMAKCAEKALFNCALGGSITNGFIVVYSDKQGQIAAHGGANRDRVIREIHDRCAAANRVCKIRKVIDSSPIYM
ncbi:hypothetical protein [Sphingopyxis sp.]|uniref:hypothetical protein n=1 Tax=Sphingopyxis sp. TaxID=1908224 RepID=UPI003F6E6C56